jgi:hypothetical protein
MNKVRLLFSAALLVGVTAFAPAQLKTERAAESDRIQQNIHKLDLLYTIVPLALQKNQYNDLLTGIETARGRQMDELKKEDDDLASVDGDVSQAIDSATQKGVPPSQTVQKKIADIFAAAQSRRTTLGEQMVSDVYDLIHEHLNAGQRKVMAETFPASALGSGVKASDIPEERKIRYYIRTVLLDPAAYPLLLEMSKHAP